MINNLFHPYVILYKLFIRGPHHLAVTRIISRSSHIIWTEWKLSLLLIGCSKLSTLRISLTRLTIWRILLWDCTHIWTYTWHRLRISILTTWTHIVRHLTSHLTRLIWTIELTIRLIIYRLRASRITWLTIDRWILTSLRILVRLVWLVWLIW